MSRKSKNKKNKQIKVKNTEFSKELLNQEKVLVWIVTLVALGITIYCIIKGFTGSLPWLATIVGFPWAAYGVSQACYYNKAKAENTKGGIKYDSIMINKLNTQTAFTFDASPYDGENGESEDNTIDPFGPI